MVYVFYVLVEYQYCWFQSYSWFCRTIAIYLCSSPVVYCCDEDTTSPSPLCVYHLGLPTTCTTWNSFRSSTYDILIFPKSHFPGVDFESSGNCVHLSLAMKSGAYGYQRGNAHEGSMIDLAV